MSVGLHSFVKQGSTEYLILIPSKVLKRCALTPASRHKKAVFKGGSVEDLGPCWKLSSRRPSQSAGDVEGKSGARSRSTRWAAEKPWCLSDTAEQNSSSGVRCQVARVEVEAGRETSGDECAEIHLEGLGKSTHWD